VSYRLIIKPSAEKQLSHLPRAIAVRVADRLEELADIPRPAGAVKLTGSKNTWRVRIGEYRIVYEIEDEGRTVLVTIIAHRREVYRGI
jgi:mRNA interferase RelE/StbE